MMKFVVKPLIGINDLNFGTDRENVRKALGDYTEFKKSKYSNNTTDDFGFCHVFYTADDKFEAVEFFQGAEVLIEEKIVFPISREDIYNVFSELTEDESGFISESESIGIYAPEDEAESILFGCENYYKI